MYGITPLNELLYGLKPKSPLPSSNLALQSRHPANDALQEANLQKQTKQAELYNKRGSFYKRSLKVPNQCTYGTLESTSGNRAGFSATKTLTENQKHILMKWMASCTKEQDNTFDQRVLVTSYQWPERKTSQYLPFLKPPLKQYLVESHSSNNQLQYWLERIATLWHLQFQ